MPPSEMWGNDEQLIAWFDAIKAKRKNPGSPAMEPIPDMTENELSKHWRQGV